jgi:hypothetical protein
MVYKIYRSDSGLDKCKCEENLKYCTYDVNIVVIFFVFFLYIASDYNIFYAALFV